MQCLIEPGLWFEVRREVLPGAPALFLDRDGVVNADRGYVGRVEDVVVLSWIGPIIAAANAGGVPVILVTNQSGIARRYFEWPAFEAVQDHIHGVLGAMGAAIDVVVACGYHETGTGALAVADHPSRKPNPGMLLHAGDALHIDLARSSLIGDSVRDIVAAARAGLAQGWLVGEGGDVPPEALPILKRFDPGTDAPAMAQRLRNKSTPF